MFPGVLDWRVCATRFRLDCLAARFRGGARGWWLAYSPLDVVGGRVLSRGWLLLGSGWRWLVWRGSGVGWLDCSGRVCSCFSGWVCWRLLAAGVAPGSCWWLALSPACGSMFPRGGDSPGWWLAVGCSIDGWRALSPRGCCWIAGGTVLVGWFLHGAVSLVGGWQLPPARGVVRRGSGVGWFAGFPAWLDCGRLVLPVWLLLAGGEGDAETSGSWVVGLSRLSARWLALSRTGVAVADCCSPAPMVGGVFPVWRWRACALGWMFFGWCGWHGSRRSAGVVGWLLVVIGSRLFDVPLVWFAIGWFWLLVFPGAWFVLAVDGRARFRCVVVWLVPRRGWIAGVVAWLLLDVPRRARFRG